MKLILGLWLVLLLTVGLAACAEQGSEVAPDRSSRRGHCSPVRRPNGQRSQCDSADATPC